MTPYLPHLRTSFLLPVAFALIACEPVTRTSPLPVDGADETISAADLGELEPALMVERLVSDLDGMVVEFGKIDDRAHLDSTLMRLEAVGTDYRTIALRLDRELAAGNEAALAAIRANRSELAAARADMDQAMAALIRTYPNKARDIRETFDKFDFGFLSAD
ncbi:hypothetical protein [uncultured Algimonas sp.]|uniref:hypothetical protein n=1 Tax=uncultured Algimonas sp. TaxID=1547920 RepID=UPI002635D381|nr:hypothetical protein [uncultured Algimonas sp.]